MEQLPEFPQGPRVGRVEGSSAELTLVKRLAGTFRPPVLVEQGPCRTETRISPRRPQVARTSRDLSRFAEPRPSGDVVGRRSPQFGSW